jgi:hypothetical protein
MARGRVLLPVGVWLALLTSAAMGGEPHRDRYGDPLPPGAVARLGTTRFLLDPGCPVLALTPDGRAVLVLADGRLFLLDAATGEVLRELRPAGEALFPSALRVIAGEGVEPPLSVTADGKWAAARVGDDVVVWEVATGRERHRLRDAAGDGLVLGPGGRSAAVFDAGAGLVRWHDCASGEQYRQWDVYEGRREELAAAGLHVSCWADPSPDGRRLAAGIRARGIMPGEEWELLRVRDAAARRFLWGSAWQEHLPSCPPAFSPDGRLIAAEELEGKITVREALSGKLRQRLRAGGERPDGGAGGGAGGPAGRGLRGRHRLGLLPPAHAASEEDPDGPVDAPAGVPRHPGGTVGQNRRSVHLRGWLGPRRAWEVLRGRVRWGVGAGRGRHAVLSPRPRLSSRLALIQERGVP